MVGCCMRVQTRGDEEVRVIELGRQRIYGQSLRTLRDDQIFLGEQQWPHPLIPLGGMLAISAVGVRVKSGGGYC